MTGRQSEARLWSIRMGDLRWKVVAESYESAVAEFEAMLIARGIERRGAEFDSVPLPVGADDQSTGRGRSDA